MYTLNLAIGCRGDPESLKPKKRCIGYSEDYNIALYTFAASATGILSGKLCITQTAGSIT
jgi:hypothetical protein